MTHVLRVILIASGMLLSTSITVAQERVQDSVGTTFRLLEGGRFIQGTSGGERILKKAFPLSTTGQFIGNAEDPAHVTWITRPFYVAETEVTVEQFRTFVEATGYRTSAERGKTQMVGWEPTPADKPLYQSYDFLRSEQFNWRNPGFPQEDTHPVVGVSRADAMAYCEWLSTQDGLRYRLPTEAEWEFACRAGTSTWFSFGDTAREVVHRFGNLGNVELERHRRHAAERQWLLDWENDPDDGFVFTAPVASYAANPWGLYDMHGNVWEWCSDLWLDTDYKAYERPRYDQPNRTAVDPVNTDQPQTPTNRFHTIRGGSWYNGDLICRSANRTCWDHDDAACYLGFRIARDAAADAAAPGRDAFEATTAAVKIIEAAGGKLYSSRGIDIEVRFDGDAFDESALSRLQWLPDLQRLRIAWRTRDAALSQAGLETIARLSNLRAIDFSSAIDPNTVDLSVLTQLQNLEVLRFPRAAPLNDTHLAALGGFTSLIEFECFGTNGGLTDAGITHLKSNSQLASLHVRENQATGSFLRELSSCPLRRLSSTPLFNGKPTLSDTGAAALAEFPKLQALTLDGQSRLGGSALRIIGQLEGLRQLSLAGCTGFTDDEFAPLAQLQRLQELNLSDTRAGDRAAAAIARIPRLRNLRIGSEQLTDAGIKDLANVVSISQLQLVSDAITDRGLESLGRINRLRQVSIASSQVTGTGLGPLTKLPELDDLALVTPALTDVAFDHLSRARSVSKLRLAHQGSRPPAALTDAGLMKMAQAVWLKELWLPRNDTGISADRIDELTTLLPKTRVIPYTVNWQ